ncbi:MAG: DUF6678 family protein [Ferruginibacter sp.]
MARNFILIKQVRNLIISELIMLNNLILFFKDRSYRYRIKIKNEPVHDEWSSWFILPSESYVETEKDGPIAIADIEWIEIDAVEIKATGKLTPPKITNHTATVINFLKSESIDFIETENHLQIKL